MLNQAQALEHGRRVGVRYYVMNDKDCIMGGTRTKAQAEAMKHRFEKDDRENPWSRGTTRFYIKCIG